MGTHTHLQCISTSGNMPPEWCKLKDSPGPPWGGCSCAASGERGSYHNTFDKSYIFICQVESEYTVHADTSWDICLSLRACSHHCTLQTSDRGNLTSNLYYVTYTKSHPLSSPLITQKLPKPRRHEVPRAYEVTEEKWEVQRRHKETLAKKNLPLSCLTRLSYDFPKVTYLHPLPVASWCYEVNICAFPQNVYGEALAPGMEAFGDGAFGRWLVYTVSCGWDPHKGFPFSEEEEREIVLSIHRHQGKATWAHPESAV